MNATISALLWCAIQVTVLTCGATVVYLAARRIHPRAGAAAAGGGLLMVIALTVLAASPWPRWSLSERGNRANARSNIETATAIDDSTATKNRASQEQPATDGSRATAHSETDSKPSYWSLFVDAINNPQPAVSAAEDDTEAYIDVTRVVSWLFVVGALVAAVRLAWGVSSVQRLARSGRAVDDARIHTIVNELRGRLELAGTVAVRELHNLTTPATVGWRRPVVLLPTAWREWSDAELSAVIAHELAHIAGRDYAAWFVARLAVVAHFYHPLVRWLAGRLQLEQELAADMAAARLLGDPKQYLHSLAALALSMPTNRMAGPARTLFPSRSLLVRRIEMLRTMGVNRSRQGAVRYATFAIVALVGLAAAGLRGPEIELAASALAQAPPDTEAPTAEAAKTAPAEPVERIGLEIVPPDAVFVLSVRPADIASHEETRALMESFGDVRRMLTDASIGVADVAEVMAMQYGKLDQAPSSNARIVVRFVTAEHRKKFLDATTKEHRMVRLPDGEKGLPPLTPRRRRRFDVWEAEIREQVTARITELDSLTLVIDEVVTGSTQASLNNAPAKWTDVWKERKEQPAIFALDVGTAWQSLWSNADPVQMFGEGAFQTLYPLITDVSWVVVDVELKEQIRLGGVFQAKDEKSAETVRETLQAAAVLLRNMARLYLTAQPQGPDGNPAPAAQFELQKRLADEADDLLASAKFETNGSRVAAAFQPTLSTEELAQLIKSVLPSVEEAREEARQQAKMNHLKQLQLAMLNFEATHKVFPAAAGYSKRPGRDPKFKHPHSWRVAILPFLGEVKLYDQYRFDEPWDSEANKKVLAQMPDVFRSPNDDANSTNTSYFVFTGPDTIFPADKASRVAQITDGTSLTFSIVEAKRPVPWTKPEDIEYAAEKPVPKVEGWVPGSFLAAFVDGHVENMSTDIEENTLRGFITKAESAGGREGGIGRYDAEFGVPLDSSAPEPTE